MGSADGLRTPHPDDRPLRVLFVVHRYTDDGANGLALRMHGFVRHFDRRRIEPYFLTINPERFDAPRLDALFVDWAAEPLAEQPRSLPQRVADRLTLAPWLLYRRYASLGALLARYCERWGIDVVVETGGFLIANIDPARLPARLVCDLIDSPMVSARRELETRPAPLQRARLRMRLAAIGAYQRRCLSRARFVAVTADRDAAEVRATNPRTEVLLLTNGVDTDYYCPRSDEMPGASLVFEGGMAYPPNVDAAHWLVEQILPRVLAARPGTTLAIVGKDPPESVRALASDLVTVTGTVDDVRPYVRGAKVFVCPMRLGAGIKNKILQAWSMGVPVVATSASIPGLSAEPGKHLLVADTPEAFARATLELLADPLAAEHPATRALAHVRREFSWRQRSRMLTDALLRVHAEQRAPLAALSVTEP